MVLLPQVVLCRMRSTTHSGKIQGWEGVLTSLMPLAGPSGKPECPGLCGTGRLWLQPTSLGHHRGDSSVAPRTELCPPPTGIGERPVAERRGPTAQTEDSVLGALGPMMGLRKVGSRGGRGHRPSVFPLSGDSGGPAGFQASLVALG